MEPRDFLTDPTALSELLSRGVKPSDCWVVTEAIGVHEQGPRILAIGEAFLQKMGRARDDLLLQNPKVLRHWSQDLESAELLRKSLMTWTPVVVGIINTRPDGTPIKFRLRVEPLYSDRHWFEFWLGHFDEV